VDGPDASVVVCVHDGTGQIERTLSSLLHQTMPAGLMEVIVVDAAGPAAGVRGIVDRLGDGDGRLRYLMEPAGSRARARNTGWQAARSPVVAFLRDDAMAHPSWLTELFAAFADLKRRPAVVGCRIEGEWAEQRPIWLHDGLLGMLGVSDLGDKTLTLEAPRLPAAGSIAYRRDLLARIGGFDERAAGLSAEQLDEDACDRVRSLGLNIVYSPRPLVRQWIGPERLTRSWFLERARDRGIAEATRDLQRHKPGFEGREELARRRLQQPAMLRERILEMAWPRARPRAFLAQCAVAQARAYADTVRRGGPADPMPAPPTRTPARQD